MTDASVIDAAGRFTKAQRAAIAQSRETIGGDFALPFRTDRSRVSQPTIRRLSDEGVVIGYCPILLTPFGLAVRAHLASQGPA